MPFLDVEELKVHFAAKTKLFSFGKTQFIRAVDGVSFSLEKGEILGLVGESGCGKSSLSRAIMQLVPATSGRVVLDGLNLSQLPRHEIRSQRLNFQMIFQDPYSSLNPRLTIFSTLSEAIRQRHPKLKNSALLEKIAELMEKVGLEPRFARKYPHEFSGGQRQRIAIARSLASDPKLIIADEPVSALDVSIQSQILNLLLDLVKTLDLTMIFISHDLSVVHYIADNIAVMNCGKIVEYGPADRVFNSPEHEYTKRLLSSAPKACWNLDR